MKILWIGDAHMPWMHKPTFQKILQLVDAFKPDIVGQCGDLYDFYSFSRFPKNPNVVSPEIELNNGRKMAEEFWRLIQRESPTHTKFYQIKGNHCDRPMKRAMELAPELASLVGPQMKAIYEFENVKTVHDSSQELVIGDTAFMHGFRGKLGDHCRFNMMNTVVGHSHRGGVFYMQTMKGKLIWELNVGYIANEKADPLRYSQQKYVQWTRGVGLIDSYGPRFIPL